MDYVIIEGYKHNLMKEVKQYMIQGYILLGPPIIIGRGNSQHEVSIPIYSQTLFKLED